MKLKQFAVCLVTFSILVTGCNSVVGNSTVSTDPKESVSLSYDVFKEEFKSFKTDFKPEDFMSISPEYITVKTTSFPENKIDSREADVLNESVSFPIRYETYYKAKDSNFLAKVNFIYYPESKKKQFVTINEISPNNDPNIIDSHKDVSRPYLQEYLITMEGYIVLVNFVDTTPNNIDTELHSKKFIDRQLSFYKQLEAKLLEINNIR
ncbi:hypothetical protein [Brevibacillus brevis]|uniref:hypothetical protein n=1 Tax=Brevibacillus brevis TaxID=1393 RepID=UPI0007D8A2B2|nr:hypothetical protein [Brevibacillus brevis]